MERTTPPSPLRLLAVAAAALATGCLGHHHGDPYDYEAPQTRIRANVRTPEVAKAPVTWKRIILGSPPRQRIAGYLETESFGSGQRWIYDRDFRLVGRISPAGLSFRYDPFGREVPLGSYDLEFSILSIFERSEDVEVSFRRVPPPRTGFEDMSPRRS